MVKYEPYIINFSDGELKINKKSSVVKSINKQMSRDKNFKILSQTVDSLAMYVSKRDIEQLKKRIKFYTTTGRLMNTKMVKKICIFNGTAFDILFKKGISVIKIMLAEISLLDLIDGNNISNNFYYLMDPDRANILDEKSIKSRLELLGYPSFIEKIKNNTKKEIVKHFTSKTMTSHIVESVPNKLLKRGHSGKSKSNSTRKSSYGLFSE